MPSGSAPIRRRTALKLLAGASGALAAPGLLKHTNAQGRDKISYHTDWRAQAEHGGFYYALANGLYAEAGLDVDLRQGGPQLNMSQLLLAGAVDMVMSNAFEAIRFAREELPFLCIAAIFQKDPQVIISHPGVGHDTLEELRGKPILVSAAGRSGYWPFLRAKFGFIDSQIRPYTFNIQPFLADRMLSQQGFLSSEPYAIERQAKFKPVIHLLADYGFENYQTTINTSRQLIASKPEVVQRFVDASLKGWDGYLNGGDGWKRTNAAILAANAQMTQDRIDHATQVMNDHGIVRSGDALKLGIGAMTAARWRRFYTTMAAAGVFPKDIAVEQAYTLDFVNNGIGA